MMNRRTTIAVLILSGVAVLAACGGSGGNIAAVNSNTAAKPAQAKTNAGVPGEKACAVFEKAGLTTGGYKTDEKKELWTCYASKSIGPEGRKSQLTYFASGNETTANHLELSLNRLLSDTDMPMDKSKEAAIKLRATYIDALAAGGDDLANFATGKPLSPEIKDAIKAMKPGNWTVGDIKIELESKDGAGIGFDLLLHFRY